MSGVLKADQRPKNFWDNWGPGRFRDLFTFSTDPVDCLNSDCLWIIFCFDTGNIRVLWMTTRQIYIWPGSPQMQWGHQKLPIKWTHFRFKVKPRHIPLGVSVFIPQIVLNSPPAGKMYDIWFNLNLQDVHNSSVYKTNENKALSTIKVFSHY